MRDFFDGGERMSRQYRPAGQIFPHFSPRYFYFNTLATSQPRVPHGSAGWRQAASLRGSADAYSFFGNTIDMKLETDEQQTGMEAALSFLAQAAAHEAANEKAVFEKILSNPELKNSPFLPRLKACFSGESIDYINFMNILKEMEMGQEQWSKQLQQTLNQFQIFNTELNSLTQRKQIEASKTPNIKQLIHDLFKEQDYAAKRQTASYSKALARTSVIGNAIRGSRRSPDATRMVKYVEENIVPLLSGKKLSLEAIPSDVDSAYTLEICRKILQMTYDELDAEGNKNPTVETATDRAIQIMEEWSAQTEGQQKRDDERYKELKRYSDQVLSAVDILEQQGQMMLGDQKNRLNVENGDIKGLTKPVRQRLSDIIEAYNPDSPTNAKLRAAAEKNFTGRGGKNNRKRYIELLTKAFKELPEDVHKKAKDRMSKQDKVDMANNLLKNSSKITMYAETEIATARGLAGIGEEVGAHLASMLIGGHGGKADIIQLGRAYIDYEDINENQLQEIQQIFLQTYEEAYEREYPEELKKYRQQLMQDGVAVFGESLFNGDMAYSVTADDRAHASALRQAEDALADKLKDLGLSYDTFSKLSNLFMQETSVKHSDYFIEGRGFHGGSIGAGLTEQITNICDLAAMGGITNMDRDWLIFAVMNCGSGMIGAGLKSTLEDYFSVFVSFLMFRTGSSLARQVQASAQGILGTSGGDNIRLYTFQGMYVPASYLLQLTYNVLSGISNDITSQAQAPAGNRAIINNNISYSDIRPWPGPQAFDNFAAANYGNVTIETQLLGGFLDLLDALQAEVNQIPI